MGVTKKVVIPMNDIMKMTKSKVLGVMKAIKLEIKKESVHVQNKESNGLQKEYKFASFNDCDTTYKILEKLWKNVQPHGMDGCSISEDESETGSQNEI
jgi:hypothetical protein